MNAWPSLGERSLLQAPIQIHESLDRLSLSQGPSLLLRIATYVIILFVVFGGVAWIHMLFGSQVQRLVCDRAAGTCEMNGHKLVPLAEVSGVELRKSHVFKGGDFYMVTLLLRDGTKKDASFQGAQSERSIAEYRASVDAVGGFLANPSQISLDTTFVYRASLGENVRMSFSFLLFLPFAALVIFLGRTDRCTFDRKAGTVSASSKRIFGRTASCEVKIDEIASLVDRRTEWGRAFDLQFGDGSRIPIVSGRALPDSLLTSLQKIVGKPVEERK